MSTTSRLVRRSSRTPSACSSAASVRDTAGWETPELGGGVGEAAGVDDRDQAAQVPQLDIHAPSV